MLLGRVSFLKFIENAIITKNATMAIMKDRTEASLKIKNPAIIENTAFRFV
ncbi:MAG: hypothetical protein LBH96_06715 [Candidatus Peribacteria bacterium]|nr:hypothetical protein [Candidatus Peribacteria bacterium]